MIASVYNKPVMKIINAHCHIYPKTIAERAVSGIAGFYGIELKLNGTTDDLISDGSAYNVVHYLVHSVATKPSQVKSINEFISSEVEAHPGLFTGYGTLHPDSEDIEGDLDHLLELGLKGVKIHPDCQGFSLAEDKAIRLGQIIRDRGLPLLTHCGDYRFDYSNPEQFEVFLKALPGLTVIGAHLGGWSVWDDVLKRIAGKYDIFVDSCSSFRFMEPSKAEEVIRAFGSDRVLWGTDYPAWDHKSELEYTSRLDLTDNEREQILYKNAAKFLRLE